MAALKIKERKKMDQTKLTEIIMSDVNLLTCDRINALKGGHGGLNIAALNVSNTIIKALLEGRDASLINSNTRDIPLDGLVQLGVDAAMATGATPSNAALLTAVMLYFTGTAARAGTPAANRKLGAMARFHAGAERCGVVAIPTPKMGNKVSGFAAVHALYDAIARKKLTGVDGGLLPMGSNGTPWGHSALGEDIIIPEVAINGARIATRAMINAFEGTGIPPSPMFAAIFGAAAVAEIIHPDAAVDEKYGSYGKVDSIYLAGSGAVKEAGLAKELEMLGSGRIFDAAKVVGDLGLILKDVGSPTVVGMLAFNDLLSCFGGSEPIMPNAIGTVNPPLSHVATAFILTLMDLLYKNGCDVKEAAGAVNKIIEKTSVDPETAKVCIYIITRKAAEVTSGPITDILACASEPAARQAIETRINRSSEILKNGGDVAKAVGVFEDDRKKTIEDRTGMVFSDMTGQEIKVSFAEIRPQARRGDPFTEKYLGFDGYFDIEVSVNGHSHYIDNVFGKALPRAAKGKINQFRRRIRSAIAKKLAASGRMPGIRQGQIWMIPHMMDIPLSAACLAGGEITYASNSLLNMVVPAAVSVEMGMHSPDEAAGLAEGAAYITNTIPGGKIRASLLGEKVLSASVKMA